jgi:DNA polymerase-3 subunit epsilon
MTHLRQIVLDTETTGIGHEQGHRIIEIGCIELYDRRLTGQHFHCYLNPQRPVDEGAFKVHGLSNTFLSDKPLFKDIKQSFIDFIKDAEVIIHNAAFDVGFINAELARIRPLSKLEDFCSIVDSLDIARTKHPGQRNSLDALCKRYQVDATDRVFHGALLDAQLLADVYLAMTSGQKKIEFNDSVLFKENNESFKILSSTSPVIHADEQEKKAHSLFLDIIKKKANTIVWDSYEVKED